MFWENRHVKPLFLKKRKLRIRIKENQGFEKEINRIRENYLVIPVNPV